MNRRELLETHRFHLAEANQTKKHVQSRLYHIAMAQMYYTLWKDSPHVIDYSIGG